MQCRGAHLLIVEPNDNGMTPLQLARYNDDKALVQQLEQCIASLCKPKETLDDMVRSRAKSKPDSC